MIVVVGDVPAAPKDIPSIRVAATDEFATEPVVAVVIDLDGAPLDQLARLRERAGLADLPLLLISRSAVPEAAVALLRADDTFVIGVGSGVAFERRLVLFLELGRARRNVAERQRFERLAAMGTMVAGFAHEVRNPVAALRSLCEELRDEGVTMPHVGLMLQMVERIERLVKTSLQFGRPAAPKRRSRAPAAIAKSALAELRPRLKMEKIVIHAEPDLPTVNVDDRQIAQALVILLNNAVDATGSAARVVLRVRRGVSVSGAVASPPTIRLEVVDDGPGISPANLGRIFDPFFTTKSTGTGLGLSIAEQIANENGARIEVISAPGETTSFAIILPAEPIAERKTDHTDSTISSLRVQRDRLS